MKTRKFFYRAVVMLLLAAGIVSCTPEPPPFGMVLSGGGAKGAYEIGVWKAFCDTGLDKRIKVYSGTSVGAINATLFASIGNPDRCTELWREAVGKVFTCNTKAIGEAVQRTVDDIETAVKEFGGGLRSGRSMTTGEKIGAAATVALSAILRVTERADAAVRGSGQSVGLCDSSQLREVLKTSLPERWRPNPPLVYVTALAKQSGEAKSFLLNGNTGDRVIDCLMASSAIPGVFESVEIDGTMYVDGGFEQRGGDNVPLKPIRENHPEVKDVFIVFLGGTGRVPSPEETPGIRLVEISPSRDISGAFGWQGVFDMSDEKVSSLIELGYNDAMRILLKNGYISGR